ncbi:MAG: carboxypeptidase-like regulatory domain-containing protein, partial [Bacteroidetes bacterium]|nr:carboxypeptidase-like regulatory domain-containing protein [Bacteroidota bacterium]
MLLTIRSLFAILLLFSLPAAAGTASPSPVTVYGTVTDADGTPLPFANLFVEGTTRGCATNLEGYYELALEPGDYVLVVRFLGYTTQRQPLSLSNSPVRRELNWVMQPEALTLQDVVISGSEDPGMAIMRKAIAAREGFRKETSSFSTDAYIKGLQRIDGAPEKIMGIRIDAGDVLDSNNAGIVYLSESYSRLHVDKPGTAGMRSKEEMLASKVSGDDQGFSWNEAAPMEVTFYDPRL